MDPLTPNYSLPKVVPAAPVPVKYIRNNLDISDIAGSHVQPLHRWQVSTSSGMQQPPHTSVHASRPTLA